MARKSDTTTNASLEKLVNGLSSAKYVINLTVVYQDSASRKWAGEAYQILESILGSEAVRVTWWNVADMQQPGVLAGAVSKAMRSDVIFIAASGSEGLPLPFYYWINSWLPHRAAGAGALVGLLGKPTPRNSESGRLRKFLRTVARRARMDLVVSERAVENKPLAV